MKDLYRQIHDILKKLIAEQTPELQPLRELASIHHFNLFVTTTPDDLLARALTAVRGAPADEIPYAPLLPTDKRRDIPEAPSSRYTAVFYLFGKADVGPFYAIHDEDSLEFPYTLQAGNGPERMFSQMRSRNLLLIGCTFADWLSRFFIRLSNPDRLFSDQRTKKEYLVGEEDRASARSHDISGTLQPGLALLSDRRRLRLWRSFTGAGANGTRRASRRRMRQPAETPASGGTIFISYSSDDLGAAKSLFDDLQTIGGDVAWFDKSALKPGDNWERQHSGSHPEVQPVSAAAVRQYGAADGRLLPAGMGRGGRALQEDRGAQIHFPHRDRPGLRRRYEPVHAAARAIQDAFQYSHAPGRKDGRRPAGRDQGPIAHAAQSEGVMTPAAPRLTIDEQNPWPGLSAFDEAAQRFFNGRREESAALRRLVMQAPLTVLFAASGLGKTSLVQAGLFPLLRKDSLPVYVRLDPRESETPLIDQAKAALLAEIGKRRVDAPEFRGCGVPLGISASRGAGVLERG